MYFVGTTYLSNIPYVTGKYDTTHNGFIDIFFGKIDVDNLEMEWASYLGGNSFDISYSMAINSQYIYISGISKSSNFPTTSNTAFQDSKIGDENIILSVFNIAGDSLKYSTFYSNTSASSTDKYQSMAIDVHPNGNVYMGGRGLGEFSSLNEIQTQTLNNKTYGILLGIEPEIINNNLSYNWLFRSKFGSGDASDPNDNDGTDIYSLDVDDDENIYIFGHTHDADSNFALSEEAFDTIKTEKRAYYFTKLHLDGNLLIDYNSYLCDIATHPENCWYSRILYNDGKIYIGGTIQSRTLPIKNAFDSTSSTRETAFISVFEPNGEGASDLVYSSYFGTLDTTKTSFIRDIDLYCGKIVFTGSTEDSIHRNQYQPINTFQTLEHMMIGTVNMTQIGTLTLESVGYYGYPNYYNANESYAIKTSPIRDFVYSAGSNSSFWKFYTEICNDTCRCPDDRYDWLELTVEECADSCKWKYNLDIPLPYSDQFFYGRVQIYYNDEFIDVTNIPRSTSLSAYLLATSDSSCFGQNTEVIVRVELFCSDNHFPDCVIEKSVICGCPCPTSKEDWMSITVDKPSPECDSTQCYIQHNWNIPQEYEGCYTDYRYINEDNPEGETGKLDTATFTAYNDCIDPTTTYNATLVLYKGSVGADSCVIDLTAYCNYNEDIYHCPTDCDSIPFDKATYTMTSPCDPDCEIKVYYETRDDCGNQDLMITGIEVVRADNGDTTACLKCPIEDLLEDVSIELIRKNPMGFDPVWHHPFDTVCNTTWRVIIASCWTSWNRRVFIDSLQIAGHEEPREPGYRTVELYQSCESECCVRGFEVCKFPYPSDSTQITDLGLLFGEDIICEDTLDLGGYEQYPCEYSCDFLDDIDSTVYSGPPIGKISIDEGKFTIRPEDIVIEYKTSQTNDIFTVITRNAQNIESLRINIIDINGKIMDVKTNSVNISLQYYSFDISDYPSGVYLFNMITNKGSVGSGKFIILKY